MILILWVFSTLACASDKPALRITSPKDGAVVKTGDTLAVNVTASGANFKGVIILSNNPELGSKEVLSAPPYRFSVKIPADTTPGSYNVIANGVVTPGHPIASKPVDIEIQRSDKPISLSAEPPVLTLRPGAQTYLSAVATYAVGQPIYLRESKSLKFVSKDPRVAKVTDEGSVTAVGNGSTQIVIQFGQQTAVTDVRVGNQF